MDVFPICDDLTDAEDDDDIATSTPVCSVRGSTLAINDQHITILHMTQSRPIFFSNITYRLSPAPFSRTQLFSGLKVVHIVTTSSLAPTSQRVTWIGLPPSSAITFAVAVTRSANGTS